MGSLSEAKVIEKNTEEVLFSCPIEQSEKAYQYAAEMEKLGLDVQVLIPGLPKTLINELGVTEKESETYLKSLDEEIEAHDDSCCHD